MDNHSQTGAAREASLDDVLADYMQRLDRRERVDRTELLAAHPELADELNEFFQTADLVEQITSGTGAQTAARPDQPPPRRLGDYELHQEIARGGMGVVFKARQVSLNRPVALKVLNASLGLTPQAVTRFRLEAETAARLHHTNIVPIYSTGTEAGVYYYAMELILGPSLDSVLRQLRNAAVPAASPANSPPLPEPLPAWVSQTLAYQPDSPAARPSAGSTTMPSGASSSTLGAGGDYFDTVARMIADVADALDYAHKQGVIHRDMKPSNLLLSPEGRLSIADFGLARMLEQPGMTMTGEFVGTPAYMSPEQITAGRVPVNHRTDVYSLGATLYELLTLQRPFPGERRDQVLAQILQKEPPRPRRVNKKIPHDLETICLKAMDKDPDRRYQTAGQMADDLRRYVNRFAIKARRAGPVERLRKWARRQPGLAAGLMVALFAGVIAGVSVWRADVAGDEVRDYAVQKALVAVMRGEFGEARDAISETERHDVSPGQLEMLRGLVAAYEGRETDAIKHLKEAVNLLPTSESATVRGLLVLVYESAGQGANELRALEDLKPVDPITQTDYLFKGAAIGKWDPQRGLRLLDQAVVGKKNSTSAVARLLRAATRMALAHDERNPLLADLAIEDVKRARGFFDDSSPVALVDGCWIHQLGAAVYEVAGQAPNQQLALDQARLDAAAASAYPNLPGALHARWNYFWNYGQRDGTLEEMRPFRWDKNFPSIGACYATSLYWRGSNEDLQEALGVLEEHEGSPVADLVRCCILAEEDPDEALKFYDIVAAGELAGYHRLRSYSLLLLLGQKHRLTSEVQREQEQSIDLPPHRKAFFNDLLSFCEGKLPEDQLQKAVDSSRSSWDRCLGHYFMGLSRLADRDRKGAEKQFEKAVETRAIGWVHYNLAIIFLERIKRNPQWPAWIPQD